MKLHIQIIIVFKNRIMIFNYAIISSRYTGSGHSLLL